MADLVLRGATVIDGTGAPRRRADVAVTAGRISAVGDIAGETGPVLDVSGLVLAPGFIDMHAHSDLALLADPGHEAKVCQGVTLEVLGQDGLSYAPATDATIGPLRDQLAGWNGTPELDYSWRSVGEYLDRLDAGAPANAAYLVPHGTVRMAVLGNADRAPSVAELDRMCAMVDEGLRDGAVGMSAGLTYTPGMYADDDELVALCRVVAAAGGYYCPHHRNYGSRVVESYAECVAIAEVSGVPLHLAHCHVNFPQNRGRAGEVVSLLDAAVARGVDVTLDSYPYGASSTYLHAPLPSWVGAGGLDAALARLSSPSGRARILAELAAGSDGNHGIGVEWSTMVVTGVGSGELEHVVGHDLAALAQAVGQDAGEYYLDLLVADRLRSSCLMHVGNEENIRTVMRSQCHTAGSDGIFAGSKPHPRAWGTFVRYLTHYTPDVLTLEECVQHLTSRPARRLGLADRGVVADGAWADLVCLDLGELRDNATYDDPRRTPDGIPHVLISGDFVVRDGARTDRLPGRAIRGTAYRPR